MARVALALALPLAVIACSDDKHVSPDGHVAEDGSIDAVPVDASLDGAVDGNEAFDAAVDGPGNDSDDGGPGNGDGGNTGDGGPSVFDGTTCQAAVEGELPSTHTGSLAGHSEVGIGSCQATELPGYIYVVAPLVDGILHLKLDTAANLALFVQDVCGDPVTELGCTDDGDPGTELLDVEVDDESLVYVFVSGDPDAAFTLQFEMFPPESLCTNLLDDDLDGWIDCGDTSSCQSSPACIPGDGPTGSPCTAHTDCQGNGPICFDELQTGTPGGTCTQSCVDASDCIGGGVCPSYWCVVPCTAGGECAPGYTCQEFADPPYCRPHCTADAQCPATGHCDLASGNCTPSEICDSGVDEDLDNVTDCEDPDCAVQPTCATAIAAACAAAAPAILGNNPGDTTTGTPLFASLCGGGSLALGNVHTFTPAASGELFLTVTSPTANNAISIRTTCADPETQLDCNYGFMTIPLNLHVTAGVPLFIFVDGQFQGEEGPYTLTVALVPD